MNAAVGCLARMPLPHGGLRPIQATPAPPSRSRSSRSGTKGQKQGLPAGVSNTTTDAISPSFCNNTLAECSRDHSKKTCMTVYIKHG